MSTLWRSHIIALAVAIAALLAMFFRDATAMANQWWNSSTYQHCLFIIPIIGWLIAMRRDEILKVEPRAWAPGLAVVALAAAVWLIGEAAGIALVRHTGLVLIIQMLVLTILGPAVLQTIIFPVFYLVFLIPFGEEFVAPLQTLTAKISMALLGVAGVPAHLDGVFITISNGWFEVAEACSGVKFLVAMVAYGALVANVCFNSWPRRIAFMILCVVVPVLANGVRAFSTIYAAHLTSAAAATGFDHIVYGWFFFAFVMGLVMLVSWRFFDRRISDPWVGALPVTAGKARPAGLVAVAALGIAAGPILWSNVVITAQRAPLPHAIALPQVPGWAVATSAPGYPWTPHFDGADHRLYGRYRATTGDDVDIAIGLYGWQGEGRKLAAFGQGVADKWSWVANAAPPPGGRADRIVAPGQIMREAVTYYAINDTLTGSAMAAKVATLRAHLLGGDQTAGTMVISATEPGARAKLNAFLGALGSPKARIGQLIAEAQGR